MPLHRLVGLYDKQWRHHGIHLFHLCPLQGGRKVWMECGGIAKQVWRCRNMFRCENRPRWLATQNQEVPRYCHLMQSSPFHFHLHKPTKVFLPCCRFPSMCTTRLLQDETLTGGRRADERWHPHHDSAQTMPKIKQKSITGEEESNRRQRWNVS